MVQWLKLPAWKIGDSGLLALAYKIIYIVGSLCVQEVASSASDRQGLNFESCV